MTNESHLETKLQRELDLPRFSRRGKSTKLRSAQNGRVIRILGSSIREQEVRVIRQVEELGAEFEVGPLRGFEEFKNREIPFLDSGRFNRVPAYIAE